MSVWKGLLTVKGVGQGRFLDSRGNATAVLNYSPRVPIRNTDRMVYANCAEV